MQFDISVKNRAGENNQSKDSKDAVYWWLAVNGPSCAASTIPLSVDVSVSPVPEQLIGFTGRDEQLKAQQLLLTAPMTQVNHFMTHVLPPKINRGEVIHIKPFNPEPPSRGPTMWSLGKLDSSILERTAILREGTFRCNPFPKQW